MSEFTPFPKISRLNREIVITEKLDGTNAAINIELYLGTYIVTAQSRNRIITPGSDNYGFARWVKQHEAALVALLGEGLHFGEWWGLGIGRNYDLSERRFSLFNTAKWGTPEVEAQFAAARANGLAIYSVPVLYTGPWTGVFGFTDGATGEFLKLDADQKWPEVEGEANPRPRFAPNFILEWLKRNGSFAVPGFKSPEGIVIFHKASGTMFKVTTERDEEYKGVNRTQDERS